MEVDFGSVGVEEEVRGERGECLLSEGRCGEGEGSV